MSYNTSTVRIALLCGPVLFLSSCIKITVSDETTSSLPGELARAGTGYVISQYRSPSDSYVEMPFEAGDIIAVTQKNYSNGVAQRIVYRSGSKVDGENHIIVRATKDRHFSKNHKSELEVHTNEYRELVRDFKREFPGRPFSLNNRPERNSYGIFGHVFFRDTGTTNCIFAWQNAKSKAINTTWIERVRDRDVDLSLRYRFCGNHMKESAAVAAISRVDIKLNPDDLRNTQEYIWRTRKDENGYLTSDDPASEAYISSPVEEGVQYLDNPDKIKVKRKKKKVTAVKKKVPTKAARGIKPEKSNIFVPPPQDDFVENPPGDAQMRQRVKNVELLSPAPSSTIPAPPGLPKIDDEVMVETRQLPRDLTAKESVRKKKVRVVRAAEPKIKDKINIPLPEDQ